MDLLSSLYDKGIKLWVDAEGLHYRAPQGAVTREEVTALRAIKNQLVEAISHGHELRFHGSAAVSSTTIAPLTEQQLALWRGLQRGGVCFLHPFALSIRGPLNVEVLQRSVAWVMQRHDSLRTRIVMIDGTPRQCVEESHCDALRVMDLSQLDDTDFQIQLQKVFAEIPNQGCDLATDLLLDLRLIIQSTHEYVLAWSVHHIISDGYSSSLMFRELWLCYAALLLGRPLPANEVAMRYADYALWQRCEQQAELHLAQHYWNERLRGAEGIRWPGDPENSAENGGSGGRVELPFGPKLSARLQDLATRSGTTLAMTVLAVYVAAVAQWCGQDDVVLTTTVTGRDRPEFEGLAGYCAQGLFLRVQLAAEDTFTLLLGKVAEELGRSLAHQDCGKAVVANPDLVAATLFQWMPWRTDEHEGVPTAELSRQIGLTVERIAVPIKLAGQSPFYRYDLMVVFCNDRDGICGTIYRTAKFAANAVERFAGHLQSLAVQAVEHPEAALRQLQSTRTQSTTTEIVS